MKTNRDYSIGLIVLFVVMLFNMFMLTKLPVRELAITSTLWTSIASLFILGVAYYRQSAWDKTKFPFYKGLIAFVILYVVLFITRGNYADSEAFTGIMLTLAFLTALAHVRMSNRQIVIFAQISLIIIFLLLIQWFTQDTPSFGFQSYIRNPNILGILIGCLLFFPLIGISHVSKWQKAVFLIGILSGILLIYTSSARAVYLLLVAVFGAKLVLSVSKTLFYYLFHIVITLNALFLLIYVFLGQSTLFSKLNDISVSLFGKNLFSGRQDLWMQAIEHGAQHPLFGDQIGILPEAYMPTDHFVHAHNQYIQVFLESGLVGIVIFLLMLLGIWKVYQKSLDNTHVRWAACFFLGFLVYQSMEISFFGNMPPIILMQWFIIAIGLSSVSTGATSTGARHANNIKTLKRRKS